MKVPSDVIGRTRPSGTALREMRVDTPDAAFGAPIARGLAAIGSAVGQVNAEYERESRYEQRKAEQEAERQRREAEALEKSSRNFKLETNFTLAKQDLSSAYTSNVQKLQPGADGWHAQATALVDDNQKRFYEANPDLTPNERAEYGLKYAREKSSIGEQALRYQLEQNDKLVLGNLSTRYDQGKQAVDANPSTENLDAQKADIFSYIDKSNLTPIQKMEQKKIADRSLATVYALKRETQARVASAAAGVPNISQVNSGIVDIVDSAAAKHGIDKDVARRFLMIESGGKSDAKSSTGAKGLFQFTEGTWAQFGQGDRNDPIANSEAFGRLYNHNRNELARALGHEPTPGQIYLAHQQGEGGAKALLSNPQGNVLDVLARAYPNRAAAAQAITVNGGKLSMTAGEFANKWVGKFDGSAAALAGTELQSDPRIASLTYEDRIKIRDEADTSANKLIAEMKNQQAAEQRAWLNSSLIGVDEGTYSQLDFDRDKELGRWNDSGDRERVESALDQRDKEAKESRGFAEFATNGQTSSRTEEDNKKMNGVYAGMSDRVAQGDGNVINQQLVPFIQQKQDIPTAFAGQISGMSRSNNPQLARYAYETMNKLAWEAPEAYAQRFSDADRDRVARYQDLKGIMPEDELFKRLNPAGDPQVLKAQDDLRKRAKEYLAGKEGGESDKVVNEDELFQAVLSGSTGLYPENTYLPGTQSPGQSPKYAMQKQGMQREFNALFTEEFAYDGDPEKATMRSVERLKRTWSATSVGGRDYVMKDAPEGAGGYRPLVSPGDDDPSHKWIDAQVRRTYNIKPDTPFELISDDQTRNEIERRQAWQAWDPKSKVPRPPEPAPPSYRVVTFERDGTIKMAADGRRSNFIPTEADISEDAKATAFAKARKEQGAVAVELYKANRIADDAGVDIDPEFTEKKKDADTLVDAMRPASAPDQVTPTRRNLGTAPRSGRLPEIR